MIAKRERLLATILFAAVVAAQTACAPKVPVSPGGVSVPSSALQWTVVYNAAVAKANRALEKSVETLASSNVLTTNQARPVIAVCGKIATASESIRGITSKGTEASWNVDKPKIAAIVAQFGSNPFAGAGVSNQTLDLAESAVSAGLTLLLSTLN